MLSRGAIPSHFAITLSAELFDGLGELGHVQTEVEQAGNVGQQGVDRRWILGVLEIVGRLPHEAEMRHSTSLRGD